MPGSPINFTIGHRTAALPDIQKDFMWQVLIPGISKVAPSATLDLEDLLIRCRSVSIPGRTTEAIKSSFMGTEQFFAGRVTPGGTVTIEFEDTEDMLIASIFYEWQQAIFNINPKSPLTAGKSQRASKTGFPGGDGYVLPISLLMYKYDGTLIDKSIMFHNAWVQGVSEVSLTYEGSSSVKYSVTFQFDYWTLVPDTTAV